MIDLHAHVLPGVDDGPATLDGCLDILRAASADGVTRIAATPHVRADYPTTPEAMEAAVDRVASAAREAGIALDVLPGGELDLTELERRDDAELRRFGLGGNAGVLLVEFPYAGWPVALDDRLFRLRARGYTVVLAHPERNPEVQVRPQRLRDVVRAGVLVQLTAASVDGRLGSATAGCARTLLEAGLAHMIASDAHAPSVRAIGMRDAVDAVGDPALARWLTEDVPASLLAGRPLPRRPQARRSIRLPWRR